MSLNTSKKNITGLAILFALVCVSFFGIQKTEAATVVDGGVTVPVTDGLNLAENMVTAANTTAQSSKEFGGDSFAYAAAKIMLQSITNSIVTWINSGFDGSPAFVSNPESFFVDVADQVAGHYIAGEGLDFMCEPFNIRLALNIDYSYQSNRKNYCRLSDVINNVENFTKFTDGDFSQGGWPSWFEITQNPSSNPLGAYVGAKIEMDQKIANALGMKENEISIGQGFLNWRDCERYADDSPDPNECIQYSDIKTPGSVIQEQLNFTIGSGQRQLELADEINEIVGALVGQLVQTVFTQGLSSVNSGDEGTISLEPALRVTCAPSQTRATTDDEVVWTASVFGGDPGPISYFWSGDEIPTVRNASTTATTTKIKYATTGTKNAQVEITKNGRTIAQDCVAAVSVPIGPELPPIDVLCTATPARANIGDIITWRAEITDTINNIGVTTFEWSGTEPLRENITSDDRTSEVQISYDEAGTKTGRVSATRNGQTVTSDCLNTVEIHRPLVVECSPYPDRVVIPGNGNVLWNVRVIDGEEGVGDPTYVWRGEGFNDRNNTQRNPTVTYSQVGTKTASVFVSRLSQNKLQFCAPNVTVSSR